MKPVGCWNHAWNSFSRVWGQMGQSNVHIDFDTWEKGTQIKKGNKRIWLTLEAVGKRVCESDRKAPRQLTWSWQGPWPWCAASTWTQPALFRGIKLWILGRKCFSLPFSLPACYSLYGVRPQWTSILPSECEYSLLPRAVAAQLLPYGFWEPTVSIAGKEGFD